MTLLVLLSGKTADFQSLREFSLVGKKPKILGKKPKISKGRETFGNKSEILAKKPKMAGKFWAKTQNGGKFWRQKFLDKNPKCSTNTKNDTLREKNGLT